MIASTIGLDLAKHNFHVHAVDTAVLDRVPKRIERFQQVMIQLDF